MLSRWIVALAALAASIACGSSSTPAPSPSPIVRRILVLGDSLAVSPSIDQGFPSVLQTRIDNAGLRWTITNAGVNGDTTADGLRRVESLLTSDVGVMILELGANDGLRGLDIATIRNNLSTIIELAQSRRLQVLLCGIETPPAHGFDYSVQFHFIFPGLAERYSTPLVPFLLEGVILMPELLGPDGVHPNAAGAQRIAETVWPYLRPMLH